MLTTVVTTLFRDERRNCASNHLGESVACGKFNCWSEENTRNNLKASY